MKRIQTDKWFIDNVLAKSIYIACTLHIDPNSVTSVGLALSLTIGVLHVFNHHWWVALFMIIRQLCDLLDGPIARQCIRTSKLGGYLDTIADYIYGGALIFVFLHVFFGFGLISIGFAIVVPVCMIIMTSILYGSKALYDHSQFAKLDEANFHNLIADNIFVTSFATVGLYLLLIALKKHIKRA